MSLFSNPPKILIQKAWSGLGMSCFRYLGVYSEYLLPLARLDCQQVRKAVGVHMCVRMCTQFTPGVTNLVTCGGQVENGRWVA